MKWKLTKLSIFWVLVVLVALLMIGDLLIMLFGGEYLAWGAVPPLPADRVQVSDACLSGSSDRCRSIGYLTTQSPESVIVYWSNTSGLVETGRNPTTGAIFYIYEACNKNFLGNQYTALHVKIHQRDGSPCARVIVYYDNSEKMTHIRIDLSWTNCLRIIEKYMPYDSNWIYRPCYNG